MGNFWVSYSDLVAQLYTPLSEEDGFSEAEITNAEGRLGFRLPRLLRGIYLLAGQREDLNQACERLIHPNALQIEDENLVFYSENQEVCIWGIALKDVHQVDPPVVCGDSVVEFSCYRTSLAVFSHYKSCSTTCPIAPRCSASYPHRSRKA